MVALLEQLQHELQRFEATSESIETIFIGGGTPSTVSPKLYKPIFSLLAPYLKKNIEITSEANPNSATQEWLEGMYSLGVNRISFGVQSFNAQKLKILNRAHSPQMAVDAIKTAHSIGFENLSLDLIYATLGDSKELLAHDLETAFALPINHLSAYALTIEEGTAFERKKEMASEELELTEWLFKEIEKRGFTQYEISNFGTYTSKHNQGYWLYKDYMGVGAGAVGKKDATRFYPLADIDAYIKNPLQIKEEMLSSEDIKIEQIFLGFRSKIGVAKRVLSSQESHKADILVQEKRLSYVSGIYYNKNYLLADEITLYLTS